MRIICSFHDTIDRPSGLLTKKIVSHYTQQVLKWVGLPHLKHLYQGVHKGSLICLRDTVVFKRTSSRPGQVKFEHTCWQSWQKILFSKKNQVFVKVKDVALKTVMEGDQFQRFACCFLFRGVVSLLAPIVHFKDFISFVITFIPFVHHV